MTWQNFYYKKQFSQQISKRELTNYIFGNLMY